jgi:hypothetical protein
MILDQNSSIALAMGGVVHAEESADNANVVDEARGPDLACGTKVFVAIPYFDKASRGCS